MSHVNPRTPLVFPRPEVGASASSASSPIVSLEKNVKAPRVFQVHPVDSVSGLIKVDKDSFFFGRGENCDVIVNEDSASRRHAAIVRQESDWYVVDLESRNGTWVNNERVHHHKLTSGDFIRVGRWFYRFFEEENLEAQYHNSLYELMTRDALTGAWTKPYLKDLLAREICHHKRSGHPLCMLLIDIDQLGAINEEYGYHIGDEVLADFGRRVKSSIRAGDAFARMGEDEFSVLMINATSCSTSIAADRIMVAVKSWPFRTSAGEISCSISCGYAECTIENSMDVAAFLRLAKQKLRQAKSSGSGNLVS